MSEYCRAPVHAQHNFFIISAHKGSYLGYVNSAQEGAVSTPLNLITYYYRECRAGNDRLLSAIFPLRLSVVKPLLIRPYWP